MPTWAIVLIWVVAAVLVVGAVVERRRGHRGARPEEKYDGKRDDFESRARMRGQTGTGPF